MTHHGWAGMDPVNPDGQNWTLGFASKILEIPERDLRDLVRITDLAPAGVLNMRDYKVQGRTPRAYPARDLITITEAVRELCGKLDFPGIADKT